MKMGSPVPMSNASKFGLFHYFKVEHIRAMLAWDFPECVKMVINLQLLIPSPIHVVGGFQCWWAYKSYFKPAETTEGFCP